MRYVWLICGLIAVGLGVIGLLLPIMPTVPFLLLASFCFARSSPRLEAWLMNHPRFGPPIRDWRARGAIAPRVKWVAIATMAGSFCIGIALLPPLLLALQGAILLAVSIFIATRPGR